jgi:hypothetical protein
MKPFVRYTALALALVFLLGGGIACIDLIHKGTIISDPLWKTAAGFLTTGTIFLGLGIRGLRRRSTLSQNLKKSLAPSSRSA